MDDKRSDRQASANMRLMAILVVFVLAIIGSLFVTSQLRKSAAMQDCLASGRTNCAPIETSR